MEKSASFWINKLQLVPHPEGGFFREIYKSTECVAHLPARYMGPRFISTSIYYLLESGQFSAFHRLRSDETLHFYQGCSLEIFILSEANGFEKILLGDDHIDCPILQYTITRGKWFAAKPQQTNSYSLIGCTVAPGFEFTDLELAEYKSLSEIFPENADLLKKYCIQ